MQSVLHNFKSVQFGALFASCTRLVHKWRRPATNPPATPVKNTAVKLLHTNSMNWTNSAMKIMWLKK